MEGAGDTRALDAATWTRAVAAGALTGIVGGAYRLLLDHMEPLRAGLVAEHGGTVVGLLALAALFAGGAAVARGLTRLAPEAAGSGIPIVEDALETGARVRWRRVLPVKFVAGGLALASGLSLGREGPTVHMGAALAEAFGERRDSGTRGALLAAGAGAGLTAAFSAPLAGLVFVLEELRVAPSLRTTGPALVAVVASHLTVSLLLGTGPMFSLPAVATPSLELVPLFVSLGMAAGLLGVVFNRGLIAALDRFDRMPSLAAAAGVGAVAAAVAWWLPAATGSGELAVRAVLEHRLGDGIAVLGALLVAKLGLTLASYGCGVPGGIFAPQLALGATLGAIVHVLAPDLASLPVLATAGMVGMFTASVRAPATGLVLVVELTQSDHLLAAQATTALAAYLVASVLGDPPIYEALRERGAQPTSPRGGVIDRPAAIGQNARPEDTP